MEKIPIKQNTRGSARSPSPTEHLNSGHIVLPGLRGSLVSPILLLTHGAVSRIGDSFGAVSLLWAMTWSNPEEKKIMYSINDLWEVRCCLL